MLGIKDLLKKQLQPQHSLQQILGMKQPPQQVQEQPQQLPANTLNLSEMQGLGGLEDTPTYHIPKMQELRYKERPTLPFL